MHIQVKQHGKRRILGLLDIYGFENLPVNGFEQLIINYCNEKLQHYVTEIVVKEEQEVYMQEGLEWSPILFPDNLAVCDLIEKVQHPNKKFNDKNYFKIKHLFIF